MLTSTLFQRKPLFALVVLVSSINLTIAQDQVLSPSPSLADTALAINEIETFDVRNGNTSLEVDSQLESDYISEVYWSEVAGQEDEDDEIQLLVNFNKDACECAEATKVRTLEDLLKELKLEKLTDAQKKAVLSNIVKILLDAEKTTSKNNPPNGKGYTEKEAKDLVAKLTADIVTALANEGIKKPENVSDVDFITAVFRDAGLFFELFAAPSGLKWKVVISVIQASPPPQGAMQQISYPNLSGTGTVTTTLQYGTVLTSGGSSYTAQVTFPAVHNGLTTWALVIQAGIDERWKHIFKDAKHVQEIINSWQASTQTGNVALLQLTTQYGPLFSQLICKGGSGALNEGIIGINHPLTKEKITVSLEQIASLVELSNAISAIDLNENKDNKVILELARRFHLTMLVYNLQKPEYKLSGEIFKEAVDRVLKAQNLKLDDKQLALALWRDEKLAKAVSDEILKILGSLIKDKIVPELDEQLKENTCPDKKEEEEVNEDEVVVDADVELEGYEPQSESNLTEPADAPGFTDPSLESLSTIFPDSAEVVPQSVSPLPETTTSIVPWTFQSF